LARTRVQVGAPSLIYRAIEDNDEELDFLRLIPLDAEGFANSNNRSLVPQNKESTEKWKAHLESCLIADIMCLIPPSDDDPAAAAAAQANKTPAPTPIGVVNLTGSRPRTVHHRNANIGIDILPGHQRRGYGSEALWSQGGWSDQLGFAMLEDEWRQRERQGRAGRHA
ncbi:hypothetical protein diail_9485, partial [Diaporthe ilicicola]